MNINANSINLNNNNQNISFNTTQTMKITQAKESDKKEEDKDTVIISKEGMEKNQINNLTKMKQAKIKQKAELMSTPTGQSENEAKIKQAKLEGLEYEIEQIQTDIEQVISESITLKKEKDQESKEKKESKAVKDPQSENKQMTNILQAESAMNEMEIKVSAQQDIEQEVQQLQSEIKKVKEQGVETSITRESVEVDGQIERKTVTTTGVKESTKKSIENKIGKIADQEKQLMNNDQNFSDIISESNSENENLEKGILHPNIEGEETIRTIHKEEK